MAIAREEIFGPVLSILTYRDEEEAIAIANDTHYGLQAYVLSADVRRAHAVASRIEARRVLVNTLAHDPAAPFGGLKRVGHWPRVRRLWAGSVPLETKAVLNVPAESGRCRRAGSSPCRRHGAPAAPTGRTW